MTLGQSIGKVRHTFSNTNDAKDKVQLTINIDYTGCTDNEIRNWLCSNRVIALARPLSKLSMEEMIEIDGTTMVASTIGQKVKSREESITILMTAGLPRELAEMAVDRPEVLAKAKIEVPDED